MQSKGKRKQFLRLLTPDDLLAPVHYPFPLRGYVLEEAEKWKNCGIAW